MDPVTMLALAIAVAIVCGVIDVALIVALVVQAIATRRYRRRAVAAERSLTLRRVVDRVRDDRQRDVMATARATTLAQHVATAPNVTALLPSADTDPRATVEIVSYRHPTERELVAWRNGSEQR